MNNMEYQSLDTKTTVIISLFISENTSALYQGSHELLENQCN